MGMVTKRARCDVAKEELGRVWSAAWGSLWFTWRNRAASEARLGQRQPNMPAADHPSVLKDSVCHRVFRTSRYELVGQNARLHVISSLCIRGGPLGQPPSLTYVVLLLVAFPSHGIITK